jgi:hypothetical protein
MNRRSLLHCLTIAVSGFLFVAAPTFIGCVTKQENAANVPIEQTRAYVITREAIHLAAVADLRLRPQDRIALERANVGLQAIVASKNWDLSAAAAALAAGGITQANTPDAILLIGSLTTLLDAFTGKTIDLKDSRNAQAWISGAAAGLAAAMGTSEPTVAARGIPTMDPTVTAAAFRQASVATRPK